MTAETRLDVLQPLVSRIATGDRQAMRELYDKTSAKLFGVCLRILMDREEAEDVMQEVYLTIWRRADRFDAGKAAVVTWISTIARNRSIDRLRARGPLAGAQDLEGVDLADETPNAESLVGRSQDAETLQGCLGELDARTQGVIRTAFFEGVTYENLALRLDTPLGTVKSWIRRGLARLKTCLDS